MSTRVDHSYDVLVASDLRFPGGTSASIAEEVIAQHRAGWRTGLVHVPDPTLDDSRPFNPRLVRCLADGQAELVGPRQPASAPLLLLRHPRVFATCELEELEVEADHVRLVVNQPPRDRQPDGRVHYDVDAVARRLQARFGSVVWSPIGPLVREVVAHDTPDLVLSKDDWCNVIDVDAWHVPRDDGPSSPPVIGRHARSHPSKWPRDATTILAAYPDTDDVAVRILGGADVALDRLGRRPDGWSILPFGAVAPLDFLRSIDVLVYFHDEDYVEAFGRTILEAMASGLPAVLPDTFRPLLLDDAHYTTPNGVLDVVRGLTSDVVTYLEASRTAVAAVRRRFGHDVHVRRVEALIGDGTGHRPPVGEGGGARVVAPGVDGVERLAVPVVGPRRRALLMSSNGAGMGHVTRLMAIARRLPDDVAVTVATQSQAAPIVRAAGFATEYLPSRGALGAEGRRWNEFLRRRIGHLVDLHGPDLVAYDGTYPYAGLVAGIEDHPDLDWVWVRRGMWRRGLGQQAVERGTAFPHVLEPGDFSSALDRGATSRDVARTHLVGPITLLDPDEVLDRDAARHELGLSQDARTVLLALGAGNIDDIRSASGRAAAMLVDRGWTVVLAQSPIAVDDLVAPLGAHVVTRYPLSRVLRSFDFVVSAAGYNSFHELMAFGVPAVLVPNTETSLDDQEARARHAHDVGAAITVPSLTHPTFVDAVTAMEDAQRRADLVAVARRAMPRNGARAGATFIEGLLGAHR